MATKLDDIGTQLHDINKKAKCAPELLDKERTVTIVDAQTFFVMTIDKKHIARKTMKLNLETYGVTLELAMTDGPELLFKGFDDVIEICKAIGAPSYFQKIVEEQKHAKDGKPIIRYHVQKHSPYYWF